MDATKHEHERMAAGQIRERMHSGPEGERGIERGGKRAATEKSLPLIASPVMQSRSDNITIE